MKTTITADLIRAGLQRIPALREARQILKNREVITQGPAWPRHPETH